MQSLIKCAGCGKKPRTKPNKERSVWSSEKKAENGLYVSKICTASGCTRPVWTRGYCADHLKELNHEAMARTFVEILRPSNNNPDVHDESFCEEEYHPRRSKSASCYRDSAPIPGPINWTQDSSDSRDGSAEDLGQSSQSSRKESVFDRLTSVKTYTGSHRHRFSCDGKGLGLKGRDSVPKGYGHIPQKYQLYDVL